MTDIIEAIENLPHFRTFACSKCGRDMRVHALQIQASCPQCGTKYKCRRYSALEIQDIIDAVLEWAGEGETFDAVLERHRQIMAARDG